MVFMNVNNKAIDRFSCEYPDLLKQIKDPPGKLYFKGNWDKSLFVKTLAVSGARRMTAYGSIMTETLITPLARAGITVISGFMYGIDARAHETTIEAGGRTIAVMPCGINRIHPDYQKKLHKMIQDNDGLILSEYSGDTQPALWSFPRRNRIIVGLSENLLVVEAGLKSGSFNTASIAKRYERPVYAVPGPLTSSVSRGTALLIQKGARIVTHEKDLLRAYNLLPEDGLFYTPDPPDLTDSQKSILQIVSAIPLGIDEISRESKRTAKETGADLTLLAMKNLLNMNDGKYYIKKRGRHAD